MTNLIPILRDGINFTPYYFYNKFLYEVAMFYGNKPNNIAFRLFEFGDDKEFEVEYRIDPIAIPLLLSLLNQLSNFHGEELQLYLNNNTATSDVLEFLEKADFFNISGDPTNPLFPLGRKILKFEDVYLGFYKGKNQRLEHRIRLYSLKDNNLSEELLKYNTNEDKRDYLNSYFTYKVKEHYRELLEVNENTKNDKNLYIDILSELITNGVIHSKSDTIALMFSDRFNTKFSISDNGIGLYESMKDKKENFYYIPNRLTNSLNVGDNFKEVNKEIINNLFILFETLFYSSLRDREGLFDLMIDVVLFGKGYFRFHTENCQIIISNRMMEELIEISKLRDLIYKTHTQYLSGSLGEVKYQKELSRNSKEMSNLFIELFNKTIQKYSNDVQYSSIRFYKVKFKGVHIEVEMPNN